MKTKYNLSDQFANESGLEKYKRVMVGADGSWAFLFYFELVYFVCNWVPGILGIALRKLVYKSIFRRTASSVTLNRNVTLRSPNKISLGPSVFIDEYAQVQAISSSKNAISIGEGTTINSFAVLNAGAPDGEISIGPRTNIGQSTVIYGNGGVDIGADVLVAGQCFIVSTSHIYGSPDVPISQQGIVAGKITIEDGAWVGAGCKILNGVKIGKGAIVAANAVVNEDVPSFTIYGGIPAKQIGSVIEKPN